MHMWYKSLTLSISLLGTLSADPILVHREEVENIKTEDGKTITIQYIVSQHCDIENNQTNQVVTPASNPNDKEPHYVVNQSSSCWKGLCSYLWSPIGAGIILCLSYGCYYAVSKCNLVSLTKACAKNAYWSLWKQQKTEHDEVDIEADLLVDMLNTYETDRYATAVARFMHDVEREQKLLNAFIKQARSVQNGTLRFAFDDYTADIMQAQACLNDLKELKKIVLGWLGKKSRTMPLT